MFNSVYRALIWGYGSVKPDTEMCIWGKWKWYPAWLEIWQSMLGCDRDGITYLRQPDTSTLFGGGQGSNYIWVRAGVLSEA